jgi:DNA helicase-2/ATP-dependent DNA helicase PcrA
MENILDGLNERQREAVTATEGFVRVIAGAGSGKTRALTRRFAYLVNQVGVLPARILCVTFTNRSASEMRRRIRTLTGDNDTGYLCTFHSFCVSVLQEEAHAVGYPEHFLVLDNTDIDAMLAVIYEERGLTLRSRTFSSARDMIEIRKAQEDYCGDMIALPLERLRRKYEGAVTADDIIFYGYLYQEKKCFGLDYNDLIYFTLHIFDQEPEIRRKWQERLEYIMIDEFQDIDQLQYRLMKVLCGWHGNLFVVGDPDQTIYTWRGADVRYLLEFDREFPGTRTILMMENYRSTPEILATANDLIARNGHRMKKELIATLPSGGRPVWFHAGSAEREAEWITGEIRKLLEGGASPREIAVLYRSHFVSRVLEEVFLREKLPYTLYSGVQFFDRAEVRDALAYLRLIALRDDLSFVRAVNRPKRNVGRRRMAFLRQYAQEQNCLLYEALSRNLEEPLFQGTKARQFVELIDGFARRCGELPISELLAGVLDESGYEAALRTEGSGDRLDNLAELKQSVYEYETTCGEETDLEHYLSHVALFTNADTADRDAVRCMTVHTAKGLEFPYVFVCSMEEGVFPSRKTDTRQAMEEERRLAFVAMTRAERGLFLSDSEGRNLDGSCRFPSRFLLDLNGDLVRGDNPPSRELLRDAREAIAWSEQGLRSDDFRGFSAGERILHPVMGSGTVLRVDEKRRAYEIQFDILSTTRTISFRAPLEPGTPAEGKHSPQI